MDKKPYKTLIAKGELKAKMFEYFRQVEETQLPIIVTDYGRPTAVISPYKDKQSIQEIFLAYQGKLKVKGDLLESENEEWGDLS